MVRTKSVAFMAVIIKFFDLPVLDVIHQKKDVMGFRSVTIIPMKKIVRLTCVEQNVEAFYAVMEDVFEPFGNATDRMIVSTHLMN
jgi:hypothetical protein